MNGSFDLPLIGVSVLVAIIASYTALDLCGRVSAARGAVRRAWLLGGSVAMGVGIWSMHFIGMLSFHLPMPIRYSVPTWLLSVVIAVIASLLALSVVSRPGVDMRGLLMAAPLMGLAIAGMHYTGMAAMRVAAAEIRYAPPLVLLSVVIAIVASFVALWLSLRFRDDTGRWAVVGKGASAVAMGLAICGMHYTGMAGASFHPTPGAADWARAEVVATRGLAVTVTLGSLLILGLALLGARIDRRVRREMASSAESADAVLRAEIGERLEVQQRLRASQDSYHSLFNCLTELVCVLDPQGGVLDVNDAAERAYGYSRAETVGQSPEMLVDPARVTPESSLRRIRAAAAGEPQQFESWARSKDGRTFPVEVVLSPATYFGEPVVLAAARDITERKKAEAELAAAELHYRRLVEASPYGIFTCGPDGALVELNHAAEQIFCARDVLGRPFTDLLERDDRTAFEETLARLREEDPRSAEMELRIRRPTGEQRLLALTLTEVREADDLPVVHGIARDITAERHQQEHLRRAERLAGVGTLIGGVAHELNNPLTSIKSFAELMLLDAPPGDDRDALETMSREANRAARIVSDLRLVALGTQEEGERTREVVDLNDVVAHVLKLRRYVLETHNVEVREELDPGGVRVLGDRGQLEQVVLNLVVNAGQAMETGAERRLLIRTRGGADGAALAVADTGAGIRTEDLERIFDPFWTTKSPGEGTGLGLSLVNSIVLDHGGTIRVESEPGAGASFELEFPAAAEPEPVAVAWVESAALGEPPRSLRILLVDDEDAIRRALGYYLNRRGHAVDVAAEGGEALRLLDRCPDEECYDVIVSDLRMPGLGGDRLLEELRARGTGLDRRIIFISGDAANPRTARELDAAAVPVMYKPFELADLMRMIETFADGTDADRLAVRTIVPGA